MDHRTQRYGPFGLSMPFTALPVVDLS